MPPAALLKFIQEMTPGRDETSKYQVLQKARSQGLKTRSEIEALVSSEPSFTKTFLEKKLTRELVDELLSFAGTAGIAFKVRPEHSFRQGSWTPKSDSLPSEFVADNLAGLFTMTGRTGGKNHTFLPTRSLHKPCDEALRRRPSISGSH